MIKKLQWDTDFFGYPVGRINTSETFFKKNTVELDNFRLVYLFSDKVLEITDSNILEVDIKTTLVKRIEKNELYPFHESISEYSGGQDTKMKSLALESGKYSRFKTDKNFINNEFIKLYSKWIEDSITKVIADKLIVFSEKTDIEGFVTLKFNTNYAEIGLIAVDENSRGKGIALALLNAAFKLTQSQGLNSIRIVTQFNNTPAMKLYHKAGLITENKQYVYHIWN